MDLSSFAPSLTLLVTTPVYEASWQGSIVAAKVLHEQDDEDPDCLEDFVNEVETMATVRISPFCPRARREACSLLFFSFLNLFCRFAILEF
jgi:hypothetical protein